MRKLGTLAALNLITGGFDMPRISRSGKAKMRTYSNSMNQRQKRKRWRQSPYLRKKYA